MKNQTENEIRLERQVIRISDELDNIYNDMYPLVPHKGFDPVIGGFPVAFNGTATFTETTGQTLSLEPNFKSKTMKERFRQLVDQVSSIKSSIQK